MDSASASGGAECEIVVTFFSPVIEYAIPQWPAVIVKLRQMRFQKIGDKSLEIWDGFLNHATVLDEKPLPIHITYSSDVKKTLMLSKDEVCLMHFLNIATHYIYRSI